MKSCTILYLSDSVNSTLYLNDFKRFYHMERLILILIGFFPVIDTFLGAIYTGESVLGVAFKSFTLVLMTFHLFLTSKSRYWIVLVLIVPVVYMIHYSTSTRLSIVSEFSSITKVLFFFISCLFFKGVSKNERNYKYVCFILVLGFITIAFNVVFGLLGYGGYTYTALQYGVKGFIYAGNEMSFLLSLLTIFLVVISKENTIKVFLVVFLSFFLGVQIATKSAVLSSFIIFLLYLVSFRVINIYLVFFLVIVPIVGLPYFIESDFILSTTERFESVSIMSMMTSGRLDYLDSLLIAIPYFGLEEFFFGYSKSYIFEITGHNGVEMDFIDIFYWHGAVLFSLLCFFVFFIINQVVIGERKVRIYLLLSFLLFFAMAFMAGHIFTSGMITPLLGLFVYFSDYNKREVLVGHRSRARLLKRF